MEVSTCPPLSKLLAQSSIAVISWVSQLCFFWNACCLSDKSLCSSKCAIIFEQTIPWYVQVICMLGKLEKLVDNYKPNTYPLSHIEDICLQVTIPLGISPVSIECWKRWANIGPSSDVRSFKTLGCRSSGPKAFEGFKPLRSFVTLSAETWMSSKKGAERLGRGTWVYVCFCWTHP